MVFRLRGLVGPYLDATVGGYPDDAGHGVQRYPGHVTSDGGFAGHGGGIFPGVEEIPSRDTERLKPET